MVFLDKKGNERQIDFTLGSFMKVKEYLNIDLLEDGNFQKFFSSKEECLGIVFVLCKKEGETFKHFLKAMDKKSIYCILDRIAEEYIASLRSKWCEEKEKQNKNKKSTAEAKPQRGRDGIRAFIEIAGSCNCTCFKELTPGELIDYKISFDKANWGLASVLLTMINNTHCFKKSDAKKPSDFNPFYQKEEEIVGDFFDVLTGGING